MSFILTAVLLIAGFFAARSFLTRFAGSDEFKRFAEEKVGEYLKAKVSIGGIKPYLFNQIALENIIIETPAEKGGSQLVRVDRILFRYRLSQLWSRKFDEPAGVVLRNPSIMIEEDQFPYRYFGNTSKGSTGFDIPSLDFKGGEIRYRLPSIGKDILLSGIEGQIRPAVGLTVRVDIRAKASGVLEGDVGVHGMVDPVKKTHDLWLELDRMNFSRDIPLPFQAISGKIHWAGKDLTFENVKALLHGWSTELSGSFKNQDGKPRTELHLRAGKEEPWLQADLFLNLSAQRIAGSVCVAQQAPFDFEGKARIEGNRFITDSLVINGIGRGKGELDLTTGNYEIAVEKGMKRLSVFSNLRGLNLSIHARLDHVRVYGMDLVTQGRLYLHAMPAFWEDRQFRFKGDIETDYFILNQQPFRDLKSSFNAGPGGITDIRCDWGRKFQMTGKIESPFKKPRANLVMRVTDFNLGEVQFFAAKPLPKELGGLLDGKLLIEGDLQKPEITGTFNIRDGKWGKIDYDRGIVTFRGFPPYFPMEGSKIWKGRSVFFLSGAVDLMLDNIFAGVKIETPDSLILWKGLEVTLHGKDGSVQIQRQGPEKQGGFSTLEVGSVTTSDPQTGSPDEERPDEKGFTVGTKVRF